MKKVILYGASGLVGSYILENLLNNSNYQEVVIVVRKDSNLHHPKLKTIIGDLHSLSDLVQGIAVDEIFIALGTTKKKTPDKNDYYEVDHDYPVLAAKLARENGAKSAFLVSAVGASSKSSVFYVRMKGETEEDIINLNFKHTSIFRPSIILGNRGENRPLEKVFKVIWKLINPVFVGKLNKYKGIEASGIADAMVNAANQTNDNDKVKVLHWKEMKALLQ